MSTQDNTNYPPRLRRLRDTMKHWELTHGERITLIAALLAEDFSSETQFYTLAKLEEHDLHPVRCFHGVCVQTGHNGKQGPEECDSEKRETFPVEVSSNGEDEDDFAEALFDMQEACKHMFGELRGWTYTYRVISLFEWNSYKRTATEISPIPKH